MSGENSPRNYNEAERDGFPDIKLEGDEIIGNQSLPYLS